MEQKYLFTLHQDLRARFHGAVLARNPYEAASLLGGEFTERPSGICTSSSNPDELGLCEVIRFRPDLFHEMNADDEALAGSLAGDVCYTRKSFGLLAKRGETIERLLRRHPIILCE